ncbi:MAG: exosortase K, partial [Bacteroidota bacterium]
EDSGFYFEQLEILIDKSSSCGNFLLLSFAMLSFTALNNLTKLYHKLLSVPLMLFMAYLTTIGVTVSRIYVSLVVEPKVEELIGTNPNWIHEAIGVATNLSFLILVYILFNKLVQAYSYEKLT